MEVTYLDESGFIEPPYDELDSAYENSNRIELTGKGQWKTGMWALAQCEFPNRQNAGGMTIGVPKEIKVQEHQVAMIPASAAELVQRGHEVVALALLWEDDPF